MSGRTCYWAGSVTPLALERAADDGRSDAFLDMHEGHARTLANLQLLGSERFSREVLGRAQATGSVVMTLNSTCSAAQSPTGILFAATGARMITQTLHELRRRGGGFGSGQPACAAGGLGAAMVLEANTLLTSAFMLNASDNVAVVAIDVPEKR